MNSWKTKTFIKNENLPLVTPFVDKRTNIDRSTLYSFSKPFEALQADIVDLRFLAKSAVDLFTSKIYVFPMKNRSLLAKKLEVFYNEIQPKKTGKMRLQIDLEFNQNRIKQLNEKFNVDMYHTKISDGKAFAAEQKIREFKKILLRSKRFEKMKKKRIKPNQLIKNAAKVMNETVSLKYGLPPEVIKEKSLDLNNEKYFREVHDFARLRKVEDNQLRNQKYDQKIDRRKRTLRSPLYLDEKVLVLAERLKKKDAPGKIFKSTTNNMPYFNRNRIFTIYKRAKLNNGSYSYWVEEDGQKVKGRFLRQELFALNNQFTQMLYTDKWILFLFT